MQNTCGSGTDVLKMSTPSLRTEELREGGTEPTTGTLVDDEVHLPALGVLGVHVPEVGRLLREDHSQDQFSRVRGEVPPVHLVLPRYSGSVNTLSKHRRP